MKKLKINRMNLEMGFDISSYDDYAYLDSETGEVLIIFDDSIASKLFNFLTDEETLEDAISTLEKNTDLSDTDRMILIEKARVEFDTNHRYLEIPKQDSRDGYEDMEDYVATVSDEHLHEVLSKAIQGKGAFRRFKDVLFRYPDAQEDWYTFKNQREHNRVVDWLKSEDIEPDFE